MRLFVLSLMMMALANCAPVTESPVEPLADVKPSNSAVPEQVDDHSRQNEVLSEENASDEDLGIVVIGTFAGESGSAILKVSDDKQATYRIGDEVLSGVYLKAVDKNFIILDVWGEAKRLPLNNQRKTQASSKANGGYTLQYKGVNYTNGEYKVVADGSVVDRDGTVIGRVDGQGQIVDPKGNVIGGLNFNQR